MVAAAMKQDLESKFKKARDSQISTSGGDVQKLISNKMRNKTSRNKKS